MGVKRKSANGNILRDTEVLEKVINPCEPSLREVRSQGTNKKFSQEAA